MTPLQGFRRWARSGPTEERVSAGLAMLIVLALLIWLMPPDGHTPADSLAAAGGVIGSGSMAATGGAPGAASGASGGTPISGSASGSLRGAGPGSAAGAVAAGGAASTG